MEVVTGPQISGKYRGRSPHMLVQMPYHCGFQERVILRSHDLTKPKPVLPEGAVQITFTDTNDLFGQLLESIVKDSAGCMQPSTDVELIRIVYNYMERGY